MGTTIVAVLETEPNDLAIASVGDSRAYLFHKGELRSVTEDQTWVQEVGRPLGLNEESLKTHPMRHVLTMAVGVGVAIRIRYYAVELAGSDIMLLSSDGLHGVIGENRIRDILGEDDSLEQKCKAFIEAANENGSPDNITVVLIRIAK
jgi:serine/threonine protein phosphatase PrpC